MPGGRRLPATVRQVACTEHRPAGTRARRLNAPQERWKNLRTRAVYWDLSDKAKDLKIDHPKFAGRRLIHNRHWAGPPKGRPTYLRNGRHIPSSLRVSNLRFRLPPDTTSGEVVTL